MKAIKILALFFLFLSVKNITAQIPCPPPEALSPGYHASVDPPTFIWIPLEQPITCTGDGYVGAVVLIDCLMYPCYLMFGGTLVDSCYTPTNVEWSWVPTDTLYPWFIRTSGGAQINNCVGHIRRIIGALPPTTIVYPINGDTGVSMTTKLKWNKIDSATSYRVHIYNTPKLNIIVKDTLLNNIDSMFVPSGILLSHTNYWWRVKPYNARGEGPFSDLSRFTTVVSVQPPAPVLSSPPNNSTGNPLTVTLSWNASPGATSYRVQAAYDSLFSSLVLNDSTVTGISKVISGLSVLTKYFWRVNGKNINITGPWSPVWNFKTMGTPTQVTLLLPSNNSINIPTSYTFRWSRAYDQTTHFIVSSYWFERVTDTVSMANLFRDTTLIDTSKAVTGMNNSTSYYWRVKAKNQIGWGNFAPWFKFTTIPAVPSAPVLISPLNGAVGQSLTPKLDWIVTPSAANYRVQVSLDSVFGTTLLDSVTVVDSLTVPVNVLINNTRYYWRVNASNAGGTSQWSSVWHFNTLLAGSSNHSGEIPKEFKLYINYPNPFNPSTIIKFDIPEEAVIKIIIYDILGKAVQTLIEGNVKPGKHEVVFDGTSYPSGVYFYKLESETFVETKRMVLIK